MQRIAMFLAILGAGASAALTGGCKSPPTQSEMAAYDYGPRPGHYEKLVRDYLKPRLVAPDCAFVELKAGPQPLYQKESLLRARQYGWAVCVMINDKDRRGAYGGFYPMVLYIREGKVVAANGDGLERAAGVRYAHASCRELGYEVP